MNLEKESFRNNVLTKVTYRSTTITTTILKFIADVELKTANKLV